MFGCKQKIGLSDGGLPSEMYSHIETEEELENILLNTSADNDENVDHDLEELEQLESIESDEIGEQLQTKDTTAENKVQTVANATNEKDKASSSCDTMICIICEKEASGAHKCFQCNQIVHVICGETGDNEGYGQNVTCMICMKKTSVLSQRSSAKEGQVEQAKKMLSYSAGHFPPVDVGTNVSLRIPEVDRGRGSARCMLAVVVGVKDGLYELGTKNGLLDHLYSRNEFIVAENNFISLQDVDMLQKLSLRKMAMLASGSKQGFIHCSCKRYCIDKKCHCKAKSVLCNSKCHSGSACKNK